MVGTEKLYDNLDAVDLIGRRTLITGDVNTGKTTLTGRLADAVCSVMRPGPAVVLDMAPTVSDALRTQTGRAKISGYVTFAAMSGATVFRGGLLPPRLQGRTAAHAEELARQNRVVIAGWLPRIRSLAPCRLLVVNDLSIFLQAGTVKELLPVFRAAETVIANGYMGEVLGKGRLSERERAGMAELAVFFEERIHLDRVYA